MLPVSMTARHIGMTECLEALHRDLKDSVGAFRIPFPILDDIHQKAKETHRTIDMQLMLATGDDIDNLMLDRHHRKERKSKCRSSN